MRRSVLTPAAGTTIPSLPSSRPWYHRPAGEASRERLYRQGGRTLARVDDSGLTRPPYFQPPRFLFSPALIVADSVDYDVLFGIPDQSSHPGSAALPLSHFPHRQLRASIWASNAGVPRPD